MVIVAALLCISGIIGINALGYFIPSNFWSVYGSNELAARQFAHAFGWMVQPMAAEDFVLWMRMALFAAWCGYVLLLLAAFFRPEVFGKHFIAIAFCLALAVGLFTPPWLSSDVYSYLVYGRMHALYGLNSYVDLPSKLRDYGDSIAPMVHWDATSRYGPLWTLISSGLSVVLATASAFTQMQAMKWIAVVSHCALALGVARLSALVDKRWQNPAFVLVAFSPLFVTEGPGSAHNDTLMLALAVWGVVLWQQAKLRSACLLLGAAGSVKFVAFALPLWLIGHRLYKQARGQPSVAILITLAFVPFLMLQFYFVGGSGSLLAAVQFSYSGTPSPTALPDVTMAAPFAVLATIGSLMVITGRWMHWTFAWTLLTFFAVAMIGPAWPWYLMWPGVFIFAGYSKFLPYAVFPYIATCAFLMYWYSVAI